MAALLAVPNVSEGRDAGRIESLAAAFGAGATLLDRHSDADHDRTVFTLAAPESPARRAENVPMADKVGPSAAGLIEALGVGAAAAVEGIEMADYAGAHPAIGALDVCPLVWLDPADRAAAHAAALAAAEVIGALGVPVFLYGDLATDSGRSERAYFRNGGLTELYLRMDAGELRPDFGPPLPHPHAGATLVTARPPLAAFNVELDSGDVEVAQAVAAGLREAGGGLPGVRAMGLLLSGGRAQVSTNVHDPLAVPLGAVVERVRELAAPLGARPLEAELVGLVPAEAMPGYPLDVPIRDFDPARHVIERRLAAMTD
jgi:glutamate formiminotransferase/glutamate formiminotransferase/formiminotetrahydrofolate cyclodeaminase